MPKEPLYPFSLGPNKGLAFTSDPDRQVHQRVHTLLGTEPGERVMLADYGVPTRSLLFAPGDTLIAETIAEQARAQMDTYEPGVLVKDVYAVPSEQGSGVSRVAINYVRREAPTTGIGIARQTNTAVIGVGGSVDEVIRG